jgi:hypothetical protein
VYAIVILHLPVISRIKASLHHVVELKLEDIHVIREYLDIFPNELPGMSHERAIEFKIELQPGTAQLPRLRIRVIFAQAHHLGVVQHYL